MEVQDPAIRNRGAFAMRRHTRVVNVMLEGPLVFPGPRVVVGAAIPSYPAPWAWCNPARRGRSSCAGRKNKASNSRAPDRDR